MDHRARTYDIFEMLLRKYGHAPSRGYVDGGMYQEGYRCTRCGYQRRTTTEEDEIEPCLVEDMEVRRTA